MADIILVQPVVGLLDNIKSAPAIPLSLIHAAALAVKEFKVLIIDQRIDKDWKEKLKAELKKGPICVGVTCMLGPQIKFALEICEAVKRNSTVPTVWGGAHGSTLTEQTAASPLVDFVVFGDGEVTLVELARALKNKTPLNEVKGLTYKENGKLIKTPDREYLELDDYPVPPYELVDVTKYLPLRFGKPTIDIESSRGCPFTCTFCYNPHVNHCRWMALKAETVLERVKYFKEKYGINSVWFIDDEMFVDLKRAKVIVEGLTKMKVKWTVQGITVKSVLRMDDAYLKMLSDAGCKQLNLGGESGCVRIHEMTKKGITPEKILEVNKKLKGSGVSPWYYFIGGFPTETEEELKMTVDLIVRILKENKQAKISGIGCYTPYPGTEMFKQSVELGYQPPKELMGWSTYAVDNINTPWVTGRRKKLIEGLQFASFFIDDKPSDVNAPWYVQAAAFLYRPIAKFRLKHMYFGFPLEIIIGNKIKKRIANQKCF